ncbi:hypothetical protein Lepto7376_1566 [[Leptolyngbya] sp. PCC 7376]|uniref:hypothetical protein n=1 Tax=[Leptolyngbya] sp. PCC 7376 TaxID=111781 RepID=UPI00029F3F14|nr:hypothetical protein [[Leptolyngbya] sp. PCC 7376]AFY37906.1 hypothetical protein Lepto7376_1566 [[Leptolyngbya] sp. PCC 7376]
MLETIESLLSNAINKRLMTFLISTYFLGYFVFHAYLRGFNYHSYNIFAAKYFTVGLWTLFFTLYHLIPYFAVYILYVWSISLPKIKKHRRRRNSTIKHKLRNAACFFIRKRRVLSRAMTSWNENNVFFLNVYMIIVFSILAKYSQLMTKVSQDYYLNSLSTLLLVSPIGVTAYTCIYKKSKYYIINIFSIIVSNLLFINYLNIWGVAFYQSYSLPHSDFSDGSGMKPVEVYLTDEKQNYFDSQNIDFSKLCWLETEGQDLIFVKNNLENHLETFVLNVDSVELLKYPDQAEWSCPYIFH